MRDNFDEALHARETRGTRVCRLLFGNYRRDGDGKCNAIQCAVNPIRKFPARFHGNGVPRGAHSLLSPRRRGRRRSAGNSTDLTAGTILIDDLKRKPATAAAVAAADDDDDLRAEFPTRLFVARVAA